MSACADVLRHKLRDIELTSWATRCFVLMSSRQQWMRSWGYFDVIPLLCFISKSSLTIMTTPKQFAVAALKGLVKHNPSSAQSIVGLRLPGLEAIAPTACLSRLPGLLEEAKDMSFGSTISEQVKFTESLHDWATSFESVIEQDQEHGISLGVSNCNLVYELMNTMASWIPKLFFSMQLNLGSKESVQRDKLHTSYSVTCKQIIVLEMLLSLALRHSADPGAVSATIDCLWSTQHAVSLGEHGIESSSVDQIGLMSCLDRLISLGVYVDSLLALKVQCQIIDLVSSMLEIGESNHSLMQALIGCGIFRHVARYFQSVFGCMLDVSRLNLAPQFLREYETIRYSMRRVWNCLLSATLDTSVAKDLWDTGLLRNLSLDWISSLVEIKTTQLTSIQSDPQFNPFVPRMEALSMLSAILRHHRELSVRLHNEATSSSSLLSQSIAEQLGSNTKSDKDHISSSTTTATTTTKSSSAAAEVQNKILALDFLLSEMFLTIISSDRIDKEVASLRSVVTKKNGKLLNQTAADYLVLIASKNNEDIVLRLQVIYVTSR